MCARQLIRKAWIVLCLKIKKEKRCIYEGEKLKKCKAQEILSTYKTTLDSRSQHDADRKNRNTERDQETAMMERYNGFILITSRCEWMQAKITHKGKVLW
jgi:hypothetical protein